MKRQTRGRLSLLAVFFTFFVDNLCWSIVFPIFAPYFLNENSSAFSSEVSPGVRTIVLGFFLMAFSLGQFLGSPVLGEYADRSGRKRALSLSIFCTFIGLVLSAWSMHKNALALLFAGRLITGVFASNASICLACVADLSPNPTRKAKNFGYLSVLGGLSFVIGAFLGGQLADISAHPSFAINTPLWFAAALTLLNYLFVWWFFQETSQVDPKAKFDLLESVHNIQQALQTHKIKRIYVIYFFFLIAWTILFQFTPVLVVQKFAFTSSDIGNLALFMGLCWALGSGYLNKWLLKAYSDFYILEICLLCFTVLCGLIVIPSQFWAVFILLGLSICLSGLAWPICTNVISNLAPRQIQGKVMGMSQSVQSLAMTVAPILGGLASHVYVGFPFLVAMTASFISALIYFVAFRNR